MANILTRRYRDAWVVVAGDLNESAERGGRDGTNLGGYQSSLWPLLEDKNTTSWLRNTLREKVPDIEGRYSYVHGGKKEQIDHLLLSLPLHDKAVGGGSLQIGRYPSEWVTKEKDAASDHSPIYVDLDIQGLKRP